MFNLFLRFADLIGSSGCVDLIDSIDLTDLSCLLELSDSIDLCDVIDLVDLIDLRDLIRATLVFLGLGLTPHIKKPIAESCHAED